MVFLNPEKKTEKTFRPLPITIAWTYPVPRPKKPRSLVTSMAAELISAALKPLPQRPITTAWTYSIPQPKASMAAMLISKAMAIKPLPQRPAATA